MSDDFESWGRYPKVRQTVIAPAWRDEFWPRSDQGPQLAVGLGRSYGDSCLNAGGTVVATRNLRRFISFDSRSGLLECEAGVSLEAIIALVAPRGWFLPVVPGTKFVSIAGAIANDIHGKNHHRNGTFGRHVVSLTLRRSGGEELVCSRSTNSDLFSATIGGLGLTGFIVSAIVQLQPMPSPWITMDSIKFANLDEFFEVSRESEGLCEYTVAWLDCLARNDSLGRGILMRGNHAAEGPPASVSLPQRLSVPLDFPSWVLNPVTIGAFNTLYYHRQRKRLVEKRVHFDPFFFPLDSIRQWNRIYGRRGFLQFQCVVPSQDMHTTIRQILNVIANSRQASFLAVMKEFGDEASPGMLSFPRKGVTLSLDFPFHGDKTRHLFDELENLVAQAGGALYPAKDACMSSEHFRQFYPRWREFQQFVDSAISSSFWRRVTCQPS